MIFQRSCTSNLRPYQFNLRSSILTSWIPYLRSPNHRTLHQHLDKALHPPVTRRHVLCQPPQHRARTVVSKVGLPHGLHFLQSDGRGAIGEDLGPVERLAKWLAATYAGKILNRTHVDRGRVYRDLFVWREMGEEELYFWFDAGDQVLAVRELAGGFMK